MQVKLLTNICPHLVRTRLYSGPIHVLLGKSFRQLMELSLEHKGATVAARFYILL